MNILSTTLLADIEAPFRLEHPFYEFLMKNFFLFCVALGVIFMVLRSYRTKRIVVLMPILVVSLSILLSLIYWLEMICADNQLPFWPIFFSDLGFILRPLVLFFFMRMTITNRKIMVISLIIIGVNALVYTIGIFSQFNDSFAKLFSWYDYSLNRDSQFKSGPLFYTCHVLGGCLLGFFIFYSLAGLKGRHRYDALACLIATAFIVLAVTLETLKPAPAYCEYLLNTNIAIACLFYVVHLYQQASVRDGLTGLFDRKAYYSDLQSIETKVTGIISIDMNMLKYINDNEGHEAGDKALKVISHIISTSLDSKHMDAYRMGGDEFIVISTSSRLNAIDNTITRIQQEMAKTPYHIALGWAKKENTTFTIDEMSKAAEEMMYENKAEYYRTSGRERRKI